MKSNYCKLIGVALFGAILTGCSASNQSSNTNSNHGDQNISFLKTANSPTQHLWYIVENNDSDHLAKDSGVNYLIVTKNGKATPYHLDMYLKDINKKSDKQVIALAKKRDKATFNDSKKDSIDYYKKDIKDSKEFQAEEKSDHDADPTIPGSENNHTDEYESQIKVDQDTINNINKTNYSTPKSQVLKISAKTDDSGNDIREEKFKLNFSGFHGANDERSSKIYKTNRQSFSLTEPQSSSIHILNKYYVGYDNDDSSDEKSGEHLLIKSNKDDSTSFDKKSTKNINVIDD